MGQAKSQSALLHAAVKWILLISLPFLVVAMNPRFLHAAVSDIAQSEKPPYRFGVFPFMSLSRLEEIFAPIAVDLSRTLGRKVHFRSAKNFKQFRSRLSKQDYDIAFIQPFDYVRTAFPSGYLPLVSRRDTLNALVVARQESPFQDPQDLKESVIGLPPETSAVSHLGLLVLTRLGLRAGQEIKIRHLKTHDACLQKLLAGIIDACATARGPLSLFKRKMNVQLKVLIKSPTIPSSLFVAHSRVIESDRKAMMKMLLSFSPIPDGRVWFPKGQPFRGVIDEDYDVVRQLWEEVRKK